MKTTFRSKLFALLALLLLAFAGAAYATSPESPPGGAVTTERLALAKKYIADVPVEAEVRAAIEQMSNMVAPDQRALYSSLAGGIDYAKLREAAELAVAQIFTDKEIQAMIDFYGSPEGKSIQTKMPQYESKMQPVMEQVLRGFVEKLQANNVMVSQTPQ
ncbi:MAG: DUF2059 domain-containing protein [Rhodospirillales bacterium]|nr:DUF2059 domain-containing protein [Alphaproteobacteria bacterium]MCB9987572.1 DUF2059 domain-containing protein [Rhodospirillales bacterium]USO07708.1 MAG: DUF2059 domain-containing protein [Rhodospirillales bacterium]